MEFIRPAFENLARFRDSQRELRQTVSVKTLVLDTHRLIERLRKQGFTEKQAEGIADALRDIDLDRLATKADLKELENHMLRWMVPLLLGQIALFSAIVEWLVA